MTADELIALLRERVDYDPETGILRRKAGFTGFPTGQRLGSPSSGGKRQTVFCDKRYQTDRLVWLLETGEFPSGPISHKNRNNRDDRFCNLQLGKAKASNANRAKRFMVRAHARFPLHDLSEVEYVDSETPIRICCPEHGPFRRAPSAYMSSPEGCPRCGFIVAMNRFKKSPEEKRVTRERYRRRHKALYRKAARKYHHANSGNPQYVARRACRNLLNRVLADTKQGKANPTAKLLGYSFEEFKAHIEQQFEPWMTWANHGEWHVDHVFAVSRFVRMGITDPRIINALSNLRPLAKQANLIKKDKLVA